MYLPLSQDTAHKQIYAGKAVLRRLGSVRRLMRELNVSRQDLSSFSGIKLTTLRKIIECRTSPTLSNYLILAELFGWNLSEDVNYLYAYRIYPSEELYARLRHLFPRTKKFASALGLPVKEFSLNRVLTYHRAPSISQFAQVLHAISQAERVRNIPDYIRAEE